MYPQDPANICATIDAQLAQFLEDEQLPPEYAEDARRYFLPLLETLITAQQKKAAPLLLGINGAQGSGKSTLAALLSRLLTSRGFNVANLSIDDFYLSRAARQSLAQDVHPLLASRGVPGTHDTELLRRKIQQLTEAGPDNRVSLPRFDKAVDDCVPQSQWPQVTGPLQFILLEGWFVGLQAQARADLEHAVNELEALEDADGRWRRTVNDTLAGKYQDVFRQLDLLVMLRAPSFEQVYEWRSLQESKLRQRTAAGAAGIMDEPRLRRFIQHFERLTRHCLQSLPGQANLVFELDAGHRILGCVKPAANPA